MGRTVGTRKGHRGRHFFAREELVADVNESLRRPQ